MKKKLILDLKKNLNIYLKKKKNLLLLKKNISDLKKKHIDKDDYHIIIKDFESNSNKVGYKIIKFSKLFGKPLVQNKLGQKFVTIKPNIKLIKKRETDKNIKLRYHQTNAGGAIHSDGPQLSIPPKYVIMGCIRQAEKGGSSIITSAEKIFLFLKKKRPEILKILSKNFFFERRGFNYANQNILSSPIFKKKNNIFKFRYLREYIEAAYSIKKIELTKKEIEAFNYLDSLLIQKKFQNKYKLNQGDIIILNNNYLAHGRSGFKISSANQRSLMRVWTK
jgi:alpha-ketoglutarate-dependent taurine dioxygenase